MPLDAQRFALINARLILPDQIIERGTLLIRDGRIEAAGASFELPTDVEVVDAGGNFVAPGFIDMHVHGGAGADFMDATPEAFETVLRAHLQHGTTSIVPTNTVGSQATILKVLELVRQFQSADRADLPHVLGGHLYGPFFAADRVGCHPHESRSPTVEEYEHYLAFADCLCVATCAPELPGAVEFFRAASRCGLRLTAAHSNATWSEMQAAYDAGMRHVDHFYCVMSSYQSIAARCGTPMQGGMLEFVFGSDGMTTELIADGCHLSPELLRLPLKLLGVDRVALVSDCSRALDMPPGQYVFGPQEEGEPFVSDGTVGRVLDGSTLASSVRGMDFMVRQMAATGVGLCTAVRMATLTPAKILGMANIIGSLEAGKRADLLLLDSDLNIQRIWLSGREVL